MTCATVGCTLESTGKSKYCREHREAARSAWLANIRKGAEERYLRDEQHAMLWAKAVEAGRKAHAAAIPTPMTVVGGVPGQDEKRWYVPEGACGFGYVTVTPGNSSFAIWLKKHTSAFKHYYGGVRVDSNFNGSQSYERAQAAAQAMADVLRKAGIKAYASANLD